MTTPTTNPPDTERETLIRVRSAPDGAWFQTETEAIATGLVTESGHESGHESETDTGFEAGVLGSRTHALAVWLVRTVARRDEPFTIEDLYRVVERGNVPMPQGTTMADVEPLLRRLEPDGERFSASRVETGGQP
jgi:hypothetical protein